MNDTHWNPSSFVYWGLSFFIIFSHKVLCMNLTTRKREHKSTQIINSMESFRMKKKKNTKKKKNKNEKYPPQSHLQTQYHKIVSILRMKSIEYY